MRDLPEGIPQIIAVVALSKGGKFNLVKAARQHLNVRRGQPLRLDMGDEILLACDSGVEIPTAGRGRVTLPADALQRLGVSGAARIALVQRPHAIAIKCVDVVETPGTHARWIDLETPCEITRQVETNPLPDQLIPHLQSRFSDLKLDHDVLAFTSGRETFDAWKSRQLLGRPDPGDDALRQSLVDERLQRQAGDGSWDDRVILTARNLRELAELGLSKGETAVQRAVEWLLARPQSEQNPGMFFGSDDLVEAQAQVIAERKQGIRSRFRQIKTSEKKRVISGDDLIRAPCGPRIMWPNALVMDALLRLGYESNERVQAALRTMSIQDWCECSYQHGLSSWRRCEPMTDAQVDAFEAQCIRQYRFGGLHDIDVLLKEADLASQSHLIRVAERKTGDASQYELRMPDHIQGCEFITTRALAFVQNTRLRRFAEAHLWRFAGIQRPDGKFPNERYGTGFDPFGILEAFARYDHPASKVVVMRALPWIVEAQNGDGSWGKGPGKDVSTSAVLGALVSLGDLLPSGYMG